MNPESTHITIFTDGSSRGNPGPGGFGAIVIAPKNYELGPPVPVRAGITNYEVTEIGGREEHTTNNRMELTAAIKALQRIHDSRFTIQVFSDSSYVINGVTKWIFGWRKNNWITSTKTPVENRDLWEELFPLTQSKEIFWKQVGGHVGIAGNVRCDEIATAFADGKKVELYSGPIEKYPTKNILDISFDVSQENEKRDAWTRSKQKAYSYVSVVGGAVHADKTWKECEARVKGKRGARYRKVFSAGEEAALVSEWSK